MSTTKTLNPNNDEEVAELLKMSINERMWAFLDECVPTKENRAIFVATNTFKFHEDMKDDDEMTLLPATPYCALLTDMIFMKSEDELMNNRTTAPYAKYFALIKDGYQPFQANCEIDVNALSSEQLDKLTLMKSGRLFYAYLEEKPESIPVIVNFDGYGKHISQNAYITLE